MLPVGDTRLFLYDAPVNVGGEYRISLGCCPESVDIPAMMAKTEFYCTNCKQTHSELEVEAILDTQMVFSGHQYTCQCHGKVLVLGDNLAYATYMLAQEPAVDSVVLVPWPEDVKATREFLIPDIPHAEKVQVIADTLPTDYLVGLEDGEYDCIMPLIWALDSAEFSLEYRCLQTVLDSKRQRSSPVSRPTEKWD